MTRKATDQNLPPALTLISYSGSKIALKIRGKTAVEKSAGESPGAFLRRDSHAAPQCGVALKWGPCKDGPQPLWGKEEGTCGCGVFGRPSGRERNGTGFF